MKFCRLVVRSSCRIFFELRSRTVRSHRPAVTSSTLPHFITETFVDRPCCSPLPCGFPVLSPTFQYFCRCDRSPVCTSGAPLCLHGSLGVRSFFLPSCSHRERILEALRGSCELFIGFSISHTCRSTLRVMKRLGHHREHPSNTIGTPVRHHRDTTRTPDGTPAGNHRTPEGSFRSPAHADERSETIPSLETPFHFDLTPPTSDFLIPNPFLRRTGFLLLQVRVACSKK